VEEILFTFTRIGGAPNAFSQITVSCGGRATLQLSDRQLMVSVILHYVGCPRLRPEALAHHLSEGRHMGSRAKRAARFRSSPSTGGFPCN